MTTQTDPKNRVYDPDVDHQWRIIKWVKRLLLRRVWYIHSPVVLMVQAQPQLINNLLNTASRPSMSRLHHRNLFASGRRYYFQALVEGFRMTTTYSRRWRYRQRTAATVVMRGKLDTLDDEITRITLESRIHVGFLMDTFLIPVAMASLLIYTPWPPLVIAASILILLSLSWVAHRANVLLEASEMVWFIQKALEDLVPAEIPVLNPSSSNVIDHDFEAAWEKFYREHRDDPK